MGLGYLWLLAHPEHRRTVRAAEEARAAAYHAFFAAVGRGISGAVGAGVRKLRHVMMRRATFRELYRLDDAMLKDLGVQRGEIWHIADSLAAAATGGQPAQEESRQAPETVAKAAPAKAAPATAAPKRHEVAPPPARAA